MITSFSNLQVFAILVLGPALLVGVAPFLRSRAFRVRFDDNTTTGALDAYKAVGALTGFVIAISLAQVQSNFRSAEELSFKEASAISQLDRLMLRSDDAVLQELRAAVAAYTRAVIEEEWPLLARGQRSVAVDTAYRVFSSPARAINPTTMRQGSIYAELLKILDDVADLREQRIGHCDTGLPPLYWSMIWGMFALLWLLAAINQPTTDRVMTLSGIAAALGLLIAFVTVIDQPFAGETHVQPLALQRILTVIQQRG